MRKVVINNCYGGFGLSPTAVKAWIDRKGVDAEAYDPYSLDGGISRDDPVLVQIVEEMGQDAAGKHAVLKIVHIPDDVDWMVCGYDGAEWVAEKHRTWR